MICRLTGRVAGLNGEAAVIDVGAVSYQVLVPRSALADLERLSGNEVTLFTIQYLEGNPAMGHLVPRLIGFLSEAERDFFSELTKVKGVGLRRALRAMSIPAHQIAQAIERGDDRTLGTLPEFGPRTATQVIAQLRGKLQRFLRPAATPLPVAELTEPQRIALEILVHWGDRRADAQRWIAAAVAAQPGLSEPEDIVRAAYRVKHSAP